MLMCVCESVSELTYYIPSNPDFSLAVNLPGPEVQVRVSVSV